MMLKPASFMRGSSTPLALDSDNAIVFPSNEPVHGWLSEGEGETEGDPKPLTFPLALLKFANTARITYACNLPSPVTSTVSARTTCLLDEEGVVPACIGKAIEALFLRASLPGGQTEIYWRGGDRKVLKFRWLCISADPAIGALWRCYAQLRSGHKLHEWKALPSDYFFGIEQDSNFIPAVQTIVLDGKEAKAIRLEHPSGRLTQFPCASGLVKVTQLAADGQATRSLEDLRLSPKGDVIAFFSDGKACRLGVAASGRKMLARAA